MCDVRIGQLGHVFAVGHYIGRRRKGEGWTTLDRSAVHVLIMHSLAGALSISRLAASGYATGKGRGRSSCPREPWQTVERSKRCRHESSSVRLGGLRRGTQRQWRAAVSSVLWPIRTAVSCSRPCSRDARAQSPPEQRFLAAAASSRRCFSRIALLRQEPPLF